MANSYLLRLNKKMKAICVYPGKKDSLHLRDDIDKPVIKKDEVLVKVLQAGVSSTDLRIANGVHGEAPEDSDYLILGHESLGQVVEIGNNINEKYSSLKQGDYVVRAVRRPCETEECFSCATGYSDMCTTNKFQEIGIKGLHGIMTEYYKESPDYLIRIPKNYKDVAVLLEPLSVVEKALRRSREAMLTGFGKVVIIGAGSIGLLQAMLFRQWGAETYVMAKSKKGNLKSKIVQEMGATYVSTKEKSLYDLREKLGNINVIVEASGNYAKAFQAMESLGNNGVLCLTGMTNGNKRKVISVEKLNHDLIQGNKVIIGTISAHVDDYKAGRESFKKFREKWPGLVEKLITSRYKLENFQAAFKKKRNDIKAVIEF